MLPSALRTPSSASTPRPRVPDENETCEFPFLQEVCTPQEEHRIDLVFIHGLNPKGRNRHPYETWTHDNGSFWPTDFLAEDIPCARIFVYGYNSSVTNAEHMSAATIKRHADTLLNLLNLERNSAQGPSPAKIIFIGHSLGGLVIKQALLNASEDPKYTSIRKATFGLVFFGTPHHGAHGVELGMLAANVAKFVSNGSASNDLMESLKYNSLFTRQMSDRFRHQLELYKVVSFVEGKPMKLWGRGVTSISHMIVDEESAVLGLSGSRETQLMLDADHSGMCKIATKGHMYKMVKGNILDLVNQALVTLQGYVAPPTMQSSPPPLPPRAESGVGSPPYGPPYSHPYSSSTPQPSAPKVTGVLFTPSSQNPKAIEAAEHKNIGRWEKSLELEQELFHELHRTLGVEHLDTLTAAYDLAYTKIGLGYCDDAMRWCSWVGGISHRVHGAEHPLSMRCDSLWSEILLSKGQYQEAASTCAKVFARQQDCLGDDDLDTLVTQRRLACSQKALEQHKDAFTRLQKRAERLEHLFGGNHTQVYAALLDCVEVMIPSVLGDAVYLARFSSEIEKASGIISAIYPDLRSSLGPENWLTIRALRMRATIRCLEGETTEASDDLHRALGNAEKALGHDNPNTIEIVIILGFLSMRTNASAGRGKTFGVDAQPWFERYLEWTEKRKGLQHPEARAVLELLATSYMAAGDFHQAENYLERLMIANRGVDTASSSQANQMLQLCKMNTRNSSRIGMGNRNKDVSSVLARLGLN
ncbi:hypothetical protein BP6252_11162 [Coleophoma cylindrospora]|uniref:DUF676 domain-containing protein n=1 Tax=Coleophoma cylindrospora TaxID=1849047 RepID=A0A3D8QPA2_9HELO|nr:hypothetical protein BP6252_11162 [Coleophoma cylindrospora]